MYIACSTKKKLLTTPLKAKVLLPNKSARMFRILIRPFSLQRADSLRTTTICKSWLDTMVPRQQAVIAAMGEISGENEYIVYNIFLLLFLEVEAKNIY